MWDGQGSQYVGRLKSLGNEGLSHCKVERRTTGHPNRKALEKIHMAHTVHHAFLKTSYELNGHTCACTVREGSGFVGKQEERQSRYEESGMCMNCY